MTDWPGMSSARRVSGPWPASRFIVAELQRAELLHLRLAVRARQRVLIGVQRRIPAGRDFAGEAAVVERQFDGGAGVRHGQV